MILDNVKSSLVLNENEKFNFTHILEQLSNNTKKNTVKTEIKKVKKTTPLSFSIDSFLLSNIRLNYIDKVNANTSSIVIGSLSSKLELLQKNNLLDLKITDFNLKIPTIFLKDQRFEIMTTNLNHTIQNIHLTKSDILSYTLQDILFKNESIVFKDIQKNLQEPLEFMNLSISSAKFTNSIEEKNQVLLSLSTPKSGSVSLSSNIDQKPFKLDGKVIVKNFTIVPYQNYIKQYINLDIKNTDVDTTIDFIVTSTNQQLDANVNISNVDLFHAQTNQELLKVKNMNFNKIQYTNNNLIIDEVFLDTFSTKFKISKDKTTNMDNLLKKPKQDTIEKVEKKEKKSIFTYYIKNLELKNGKVEFSDHSLPLNFDTNIHKLHTKVKNLSSQNKKTDILFKGVVEKYGMATIQARTILTNFKDTTDVIVDFENLDVRSYSPYSGKFIGQKIADGRLWLNLNYNIKEGQLLSTNNIKIKNLTLGDDVKSPDALSLPVGLAIALLEDSDGLIDLDVPIVGDMNNPEFQLGGVIWKTLKNVITNIVSAPFKFLGSLLGIDSKELGQIEFEFATANIEAPQKEKLDQLISVLKEKKALVIVLQASYDKEKDTLAIVEKKFKELVKSKDIKKKIEKIYIKRFSKEKFEELKKNSTQEKFHIILTNEIKKTIFTDTLELEKLAKQRVVNLQNYFVSHKLRLDRIQIKDKVIEKRSLSDLVFTLQLELNIKDEK